VNLVIAHFAIKDELLLHGLLKPEGRFPVPAVAFCQCDLIMTRVDRSAEMAE